MFFSRLACSLLVVFFAAVLPVQAQVGNITATYTAATDVPVTEFNPVLTGGTATLTLGYSPVAGTDLMVVKNTGLAFISGTFSNLVQGHTVSLSYGDATYDFVVNYYGGTGNDLVLVWKLSRALAWGHNFFGQLGNNMTAQSTVPVAVTTAGLLAGKTVVSVAAGSYHSVALCSDGTVASWGSNTSGQLGNNLTAQSIVPVAVTATGLLAGKTVIAIAAGADHSLALCADGTVAAWGDNSLGQLGNNLVPQSTVPVAVTATGLLAGKTVVAITAGAYHSLALCADGTVAAWGANFSGQLGNDSTESSYVPVAVTATGLLAGKTVIAIAAGAYHSLALCADGTVAAWGANLSGQLGNGSTESSTEPVAVTSTGLFAGKTVIAITAGAEHSLALCADGTAAAWGANSSGQLGNNSMAPSTAPVAVTATGLLGGKTVVAVAAGNYHSVALCSDGIVVAWGYNGSGQLGDNSTTESLVPVAVDSAVLTTEERFSKLFVGSSAYHTFALVSTAFTSMVSTPTITSVTDSTATLGGNVISEGGAPITERGVVYARTSDNSDPLIGGANVTKVTTSGTIGVFTVPVSGLSGGTGYSFKAYATNSIGTSYTSGDIFNTLVGNLTATYTSATDAPVTVSSPTLTGGTCTITLGYVPTTGADLMVVNNTGIGFISGTFSNLLQGQTISLSYGGVTYDFVVNYYGGTGNDLVLVWKNNRALAWGSNYTGKLGNNSTNNSLVPVAVMTTGLLAGKTLVAVAGGRTHSLALCADGTVAAWGSNAYGQLGNNTTTESRVPVAVTTTGVLAGKTVVAVAAGDSYSMALCSDGTVAAWGDNYLGKLGNNSTLQSNVPVAVTLTGVLAGKTVVSIAAGQDHSLALCSDGTVVAWGSDYDGELGSYSTTTFSSVPVAVAADYVLAGKTVVSVTAGPNHSMALCSDGTVVAWGDNSDGQLGNNSTWDSHSPVVVMATGVLAGKTVVSIAAGYDHSVALCSDGTLAAWGRNDDGQIGNNTTTDSNVPVDVTAMGVLAGKTVAAVAVGGSHCIALCSDGTVATWGRNTEGQLGINSTSVSLVPMAVSSNLLAPGERFSKLFVASPTSHTLVLTSVPYTTPKVSMAKSAVVTVSTATLGGNVTDDGYVAVTERGVVFAKTSENSDPLIGGENVTKVTAGGTTGFFEVNVNELTSDTSYHFKAYAINALGTTYTSVMSFTTALIQGDLSWIYTGATDVPVTISNPILNGAATLTLGYAPVAGTDLIVLKNAGGRFISGTFSNLAQGQTVSLVYGGVRYDFVVNYYGGTGNDLVLMWKNNRALAWGRNYNGELGNNSTTPTSVPVAVTATGALAGKTVVSVAAGLYHNVALCSDGTLAAWGRNDHGALGNNSMVDSSVPVGVMATGVLAGKTVVAIAAGNYHSMAVCSDGTLAAWGSNTFGQLGNNTMTQSNVPVAVAATGVLAGKTVVAAAGAYSHSLALCSDGTVAAWGNDYHGQLGNNATDSSVPVEVSPGVLAGRTVVSVAAGYLYSVALCADGTVAAWGSNTYGQLGNNSITQSNVPVAVTTAGVLAGKTVVSITTGESHVLALCSDGTVAAWGANTYGQLGNNSITQSNVPVMVTTAGVLAGKTVVAVAAGSHHSVALCTDGTLTTWGRNDYGQLGNNSTTQSLVPVAASSGVLTVGERFSKLFVGYGVGHSLALASVPPGSPKVSKPTITSVTVSSAILGGNITDDNGAEITERGVVYAKTNENSSPLIGGVNVTKVPVSGMTGAFTTDVTGLSLGTDYSFKAYATNLLGTTYTSVASFTTTLIQGGLTWTYAGATDVPAKGFGATLTGGTATLALGYAPVAGTDLMVVKNTGAAFISGTFSNLTQGQTVTLNYGGTAYDFVVNYYGGTGNDLVLVWKLGRVMAWGLSSSGQLGNNLTTNSLTPVGVTATGVLASKTVVAVAAGVYHSMALCSDGTVATWGDNFTGQLGNNSTSDSLVPVEVMATSVLSGKTVVSVAAGSFHSMALCSDGTVATWGDNYSGVLGNNTTTPSTVPVEVMTTGVLAGKIVVAIAAGGSHSMALCSDGTVVTWGYNYSGQLGNNTTSSSMVPVAVTKTGVLAGKIVVAIAAGGSHSTALCSDGTVAAWGSNYAGQLGNNMTTSSNVPVAVTATGVLMGKTVVAIASGDAHSMALCSDGTVASWGNDYYGQLGSSANASVLSSVPVAVTTTGVLAGKTVVGVAAGISHSVALCSDGTAATWGGNGDGQLGNNSTSDSFAPAAVNSAALVPGERFSKLFVGSSARHTLALTSALTYPPPTAPLVTAPSSQGTTPFTASLGGTVTSEGGVAITERGVVYAQTSLNGNPLIGGANVTKVTESGTTGIFTVPVTGLMQGTIYSFKAYATNSLGTTYTSVSIFTTQIGNVTATYTAATDVPVTLSNPVLSGGVATLALGYTPTPGTDLMVVKNPGLGFISGIFSNLGQGQTVTLSYEAVTYDFVVNYNGGTGNDLVLVWKNNRALAWGSNASGELGNNMATMSFVPVAVSVTGVLTRKTMVSVAAGGAHSVALSADGTVATWGNNAFGQLGNNSTTMSLAPVAVTTMGVLAGKTVVAVAAGKSHSLALCSDGSVAAWGLNTNGQLGNNSTTNRLVPVAVTATGVLAGKKVVAVNAGESHSLALCSDGTVAAWGINTYGQLGNNSTTQSLVPVAVTTTGVLSGRTVVSLAAGGYHNVVLCADGTVAAWGRNTYGQLGNNSTTQSLVPVAVTTTGVLAGKTVVSVATGLYHSLALCADGSVAAWGRNNNGQLGDDSTANSRVPVAVPATGVLTGKTVVAIAAGDSHSVVLCSDATVASWGLNSSGQLGNNSTAQSLVPVTVNNAVFVPGERFSKLFVGPTATHTFALTSSPLTAPLVISPSSSIVTPSTAALSGIVTNDGGATITERGVVYAQTNLNNDPLIGGANVTKATTSGTIGFFTVSVSSLNPHTGYTFKAYATTSVGTTYTSVSTFTTLNRIPTAPNGSTTGTTGDQKMITISFPSTDPDGDAVAITAATAVTGLTVDSFTGTSVTFTPASNFTGNGSFTYTVSDGFATATGTITVAVTDNDAPVVTGPVDFTTHATSPTGAFVSFTPTATDAIGVTSLLASPASGSFFPNGTTAVTVTAKDAANNTGTSSFTVTVTPLTAAETWRYQNFGTADNSGNAADNSDFDNDGVKNVMELAFDTEPNNAGAGLGGLNYVGTFAGSGTILSRGQPRVMVENGTDFRALFVRRTDHIAAGLTYTVEFSATLHSWEASVTTPTVLADDGIGQIVSVPYPALVGGEATRFFRVQVSLAP